MAGRRPRTGLTRSAVPDTRRCARRTRSRAAVSGRAQALAAFECRNVFWLGKHDLGTDLARNRGKRLPRYYVTREYSENVIRPSPFKCQNGSKVVLFKPKNNSARDKNRPGISQGISARSGSQGSRWTGAHADSRAPLP